MRNCHLGAGPGTRLLDGFAVSASFDRQTPHSKALGLRSLHILIQFVQRQHVDDSVNVLAGNECTTIHIEDFAAIHNRVIRRLLLLLIPRLLHLVEDVLSPVQLLRRQQLLPQSSASASPGADRSAWSRRCTAAASSTLKHTIHIVRRRA